MELTELYSKTENTSCKGCKVLELNKPFHCWKDYLSLGKADILFLTGSFRYNGWERQILSDGERDLFNEVVFPLVNGISYTLAASVKCPNVKEANMDAESMGICRNYLYETIKVVSPKLIIPLGNLAFKMLMKGSGVGKHHGCEFEFEGIPVVPTYDPSILFIEPKYRENIIRDINLAVNKFLRKTNKPLDLDWQILGSLTDIDEAIIQHNLFNMTEPIAVDTETTGLNFLTDQLLTISFTWKNGGKNKSICIPIYHKESKFNEEDLDAIFSDINRITTNPNNIKVLQNSKFDQKFLLKHRVKFVNVWDTATMAHLIDEYQSVRLVDLVKKYFPDTLETL